MSADKRYEDVIKREMSKLKKPVRLKVFTSRKRQPDGSVFRECQQCNTFMGLLEVYEKYSNRLLTIDELSIYDDAEYAKRYDVQRVPTILFVDEEGREIIRYLAAPQAGEIQPFIQALFTFAGVPNYYEATIKQNLNRIQPSTIKVMLTMSCPYCPQVASVANLFALASGGKIRTVIVDIGDPSNSDIARYYDSQGVPYTIINDKKTLVGMVGPNEILRELIGGNIRVQY